MSDDFFVTVDGSEEVIVLTVETPGMPGSPGATGPQGEPGATGASGPPGGDGLINVVAWDDSTAFEAGQVVYVDEGDDGADPPVVDLWYYLATQTSTNEWPNDDSDYWVRIAGGPAKAAGEDNQVQVNSSGDLRGSDAFTFDPSYRQMNIGTDEDAVSVEHKGNAFTALDSGAEWWSSGYGKQLLRFNTVDGEYYFGEGTDENSLVKLSMANDVRSGGGLALTTSDMSGTTGLVIGAGGRLGLLRANGSIDWQTEGKVLSTDSSDFPVWADAGSGGGGGAGAVTRLIDVYVVTNDDVPLTHEAWGSMPSGFLVMVTNHNHSAPGIYETDGTYTLTYRDDLSDGIAQLMIVQTAATLDTVPLTSFDTINRTYLLPAGFDWTSEPLPLTVSAGDVVSNGQWVNIPNPGQAPETLESALSKIDALLYPEPPASGNFLLRSVDGVLSWEAV